MDVFCTLANSESSHIPRPSLESDLEGLAHVRSLAPYCARPAALFDFLNLLQRVTILRWWGFPLHLASVKFSLTLNPFQWSVALRASDFLCERQTRSVALLVNHCRACRLTSQHHRVKRCLWCRVHFWVNDCCNAIFALTGHRELVSVKPLNERICRLTYSST